MSDLTPPGEQPRDDAEPPTGGMSVDDWLAANAGRPSPPPPVPARPEMDVVSLVGFILGLTVCCPPVPLVMGIIGLRRTAGGKRTLRWAAVSSVVIGALGSLILVVGIGVAIWFESRTVDPADAEVGQCVDLDESDYGYTMYGSTCDEQHDAEVVVAGTFTAAQARSADVESVWDICGPEMSRDYYQVAVRRSLEVGIDAEEWDLSLPATGSPYVCFLKPTDGTLDAPLLTEDEPDRDKGGRQRL